MKVFRVQLSLRDPLCNRIMDPLQERLFPRLWGYVICIVTLLFIPRNRHHFRNGLDFNMLETFKRFLSIIIILEYPNTHLLFSKRTLYRIVASNIFKAKQLMWTRILTSGNTWTVATYRKVPAENNMATPTIKIEINSFIRRKILHPINQESIRLNYAPQEKK